MKVKLNFDRRAIQEFLVENVEKIVFAGVAVCFLLIIYGAMGRESLKQAPRELETLASETKTHIEQTPPDPKVAPKVGDFKVVVGRRDHVEEKPYEIKPLADPMFRRQDIRDRPPVKLVEDLMAVAGRGAMSKAGGSARGGTSRTEGHRYILLTGVVPLKEQNKAFAEALENGAAGAGPELPTYRFFYVQRAELSGDEPADKLKWTRLDTAAAMKKAQELDRVAGEAPLERAFADPVLMQPLPARLDQPWGAEILHPRLVGPAFDLVCRDPDAFKSKQVTWLGDYTNACTVGGKTYAVFRYVRGTDNRGRGAMGPSSAEGGYFAVETANPEAISNRASSGITGTVQGKVAVQVPAVDAAGQGRRGGRPARLPDAGTEEAAETVQTAVPVLKADLGDLEAVRPDGRGPGAELMLDPEKAAAEPPPAGAAARNQAVARRPGRQSEAAAESDYLLFRFIDLDVEPGKQYRYRVQLLLNNPNYRKDPQRLEIPGDSQEPYLPVKKDREDPKSWSEPSNVVSLPSDVEVLALGVNPVPRAWADPTAKIAIVKWNAKNGREAYAKFPSNAPPPGEPTSCTRGLVLDFGEKQFTPGGVADAAAAGGRGQPAAGRAASAPGERGAPKAAEGRPVPGETPGRATPGRTAPKAKGPASADDGLLGPRDRRPGPGVRVGAQPVGFKVVYDTGAVLLDMRGGEKLPGRDRSTQPGEILVLSADGNLQIRNEIDDEATYEQKEAAAAAGPVENVDVIRAGPAGRQPRVRERGPGAGL